MNEIPTAVPPGRQRRPDASRAPDRTRYDAIVIGGGVNGLTCAAMLGKAGVRTVLIEQRDEVGGCAAEGEIAPGFRVPTLAHATGPVRRDVVEQLQLYLPRARRFSTARSRSAASRPMDGR